MRKGGALQTATRTLILCVAFCEARAFEPMNLIDRYVGHSVLVATIYGVVVLSVVLVLGNIFKELLDLLINRDVPVKYVLLFMLYVLPFSLTFTVPWGFLTAVLLVFGRMSADNEMIALRACGVSLLRVCLPVVFVGALLSLFTFWINASVAPRAEQAMRESIASMARSNPVALFVADEVVSQFRGKKIFVGGKKGDVLADLTIIEQTDGSSITRVIYAREGRIEAEEKKGALLLKLSDAKFEQRQEGEENNFDKIQHGISIGEVSVDIPFEDLVDQGLRSRPLRSYTVPELRAYFSTVKSLSERTAVLTELSKRFSLSLACIAFALAAMPLGITAQRKETSVGFGISLGLAFSYFLFVVLAEMLRNDAQFYPYLLLWIPNLLFVGIGGWLLLRLDYR